MKKQKIVFITNTGWFHNFQRPHHFARCFRDKFDITVIDNSVFLPHFRSGYVRELEALADRIITICRIKGNKIGPVRKFNNYLKAMQYKRIMNSKYVRDADILYSWNVNDPEYLQYVKGKLLIYDAMDDWSAFSDTVDHALIERELAVARRAQAILTVSDKLHDKFVQINPNTFTVRNGVDVDFFRSVLDYIKKPSDELGSLSGKAIIGYVGHIHTWVDVQLIVDVALRLTGYEFVVIGPGQRQLTDLFSQAPNISYLGPRPYSDLIGYLAYFNVGIIPFKLNLLNESTNPIKLYEYLGAGIPVVSTGMREVKLYEEDGVVYIADSVDLFVKQIENAVKAADDSRFVARRLAMAQENSWQARTDQILRIAEQVRNH